MMNYIAKRLPNWPLSRWLLCVAMFWAYFFLVAVTFTLVWPFKTATVKTPVKVLTPVVKNGEDLHLQISYCKYRKGPVTVQRQIVDGIIYSLPDVTSNLPLGCRTITVNADLPESLPPGTYYIKYTSVYKITDYRHIYINYQTEPFTIQ